MKTPEPISPNDTTPAPLSISSTLVKTADSPAGPALPTAAKEETPRVAAVTEPKADLVVRAQPAAPAKETRETPPDARPITHEVPAAVFAAEDRDPLKIGRVQLCRKVLGFGSFEPLGESNVKAGQRLLVYCEVTGMQPEPKNASFVSRLSSKLEIRSAGSGAVLWARELGPAEDVCGSRRHDFYVNYRVDLPRSLAPGDYRLRLTQTDLIASRSTSTEIPLAIVP
jgi:hypothetical protein